MKKLILTTQNSEAFRRLLAQGHLPKLQDFTGFTLGGALELFGTAQVSSGDALRRQVEKATPSSPLWSALSQEWSGLQSEEVTDIHGTREFEFFRLRTARDQTGLAYQLFQERFVRSMQQVGGFSGSFPMALASVINAMTDNVIQHSADMEPYSGMAGYYIGRGCVDIGVLDIGCGTLESLRRSSEWECLTSSRESLLAIVQRRASRRTGQGPGEGFQSVFQNLVDRNAQIRLRSGDATINIRSGAETREAQVSSSTELRGVQLTLSCSLKGSPAEIPVNFAC